MQIHERNLTFQRYNPIIATYFHDCKENRCISQNVRCSGNLYVMALQPNLLSGLDRTIALAWSKAQCVGAGCFPRLFLDYEIYYNGDLCAEFKSRLNDFEILFE